MILAFTALSACDPEFEPGDTPESFRAEDHVDDVVHTADLELVYELRRVRDADGNVVRTAEFGRLDLETWQKVARPSAHLDDEFIYIEEAGTNSTRDGGSEQVYRVRRIPNVAPPVPEYEAPDPSEIITPKLVEALAEIEADDVVRVMLKLPNYPDSNLPLLPEVTAVSVEDYRAAQAARDAAIEDRKARFERLSADLVTAIEKSGGEVVDEYWLIGWINADLSKAAVQSLSRSGLVNRMHPDDMGGKEAGIPLGTGRARIATDTQTFWDNGYHGEDPDTGVAIHVAIQEVNGVEDEACFWGDGASCTPDRLLNRFQCNGVTSCTATSTAAYDVDGQSHGTGVSAVLAADYTQNQADGFTVCDGINTVHDTTFEGKASGYAKEAVVSYFDHLGSAVESRFVDSTQCLMGLGPDCVAVDIVNNSTGWGPFCDADSSSALEDVVEEAFDDGIFLVYPAGNEGSQGVCNVISPSDTPKVFAVNGVDVTATAYANAPIDNSGACDTLDCAAKGGGTVESPNGSIRVGALSMVALAAISNGMSFVTVNDATEKGCVNPTAGPVGTSAASPAVAGMAAVLKSFHLDRGDTWVSNPGRLFTMMLAMGDREDTLGGTNFSGTDNHFGLGRAKLRLMLNGQPSDDPGSYWMVTHTFTSGGASSYVDIMFGGAVAVGAEEVKCVSFAQEDMSGKDNISDIDLEVRLRGLNGSGVCAEGEGTLYNTRTDTSWDNKKMVAFEDAGNNIEGRCVEVTLDRATMSSSGSVVVNTFCMYTSEVDDEPNI